MSKFPPIKNTAGEGFSVEDAVVAWLSCHLLSGIPWPNKAAGVLRAVHCQMRQDGWGFDDVVIELLRNGVDHKIGCSIKSFPVFGPQGAPAEFVSAVWTEWTGATSPFRPGVDQLAIFQTVNNHETSETWKGLLDAAHAMPAETLARRMSEGRESSSSKRTAFASMRCPAAIDAQAHGNLEETARLLASLSFQEHDFDHDESTSVAHAVALCQQCLADSARDQAVGLWEALLGFAAEVRKKGGTIDLSKLLERIVLRFPLKQHPSFAADWEKMRSISADLMSVVPAKIGGIVKVDREKIFDRISSVAKHHKIATVLGASGYGKTVSTCDWAMRDPNAISILIRSNDLVVPGGLRAFWNLGHSLSEIFANAAKPVRTVFDGLDKCFDDQAFAEAALFLKSTIRPELNGRIEIAITCSPDDWDRVRRSLLRHGVSLDFECVIVGEFLQKGLEKVAEQLPALCPLLQRAHLKPLLRWPKVLDIIALYWRAEDSSPTWATESDFARWFWKSAIARHESISIRDRAARKLAVMLADRLAGSVGLNEFSNEEIAILRDLHREQHLNIDDDRQTVRFAHDLVADFARLRELLAQGENAEALLRQRLHSPFWHRAVRLYGLDLLEQRPDSNEWEKFFLRFKLAGPADEMVQNLLLESPIFALNQRGILERLWPLLRADRGELLKRFLRQFLRVATIPNEHIIANFGDRGADFIQDVALMYRWPFGPYWHGVLAFLNDHVEEVVTMARAEVADICLLWLPLAEYTKLNMAQAANLAVTSARIFYRSGEERHASHGEVSPELKVCRALLAAAPVMPDEVTELALKMSGRREPEPEDGLPVEEPEQPSRLLRIRGPARPWPEGLRIPAVSVFGQAFMDRFSAEPFLKALPVVAEEVMFGILLDIPHEGDSPDTIHDFDQHGFSREWSRSESSFWSGGPFLGFLQAHPQIALPAIIRLVNFGTSRALELGEDSRTPMEIDLKIGEEIRTWRGHQYSYHWHRGHVFGPQAVCSALLSIERWLYQLMDADQPIEPYLDTILQESRSIALGAVLVAVGKRKPELFLGALKPLLATPEFFQLEKSIENLSNVGAFWSPSWNDPETIRKAWKEWGEMPHRKEMLGQLVVRKFLSNAEWRDAMTEICGDWRARIDASTNENPAPLWLHGLIAQFDLSNWHTRPHEEGTLIIFEPPATLPQPSPEEQQRFQRLEKLMLLPFECGQILAGEKPSTEQQVEQWWNDLSAIEALPVPEEEIGIRDVEDAVCGVIAVAVVHHRRWLAADRSREKEVLEILQTIAMNPPRSYEATCRILEPCEKGAIHCHRPFLNLHPQRLGGNLFYGRVRVSFWMRRKLD